MSSGQDTEGPPSSGAPDIDGYTIERIAGQGATAIVYQARERKHGRMVALKVLRTDLSESLHSERFLREIDIIAGLSHPNILPLLDSGRTGDRLYYVTPYVPGESLRSRLHRERQLGFAESVGIVREVAEALDYAHRIGVVHRDIKPENILLADGHAVVADFGIARALSLAGDPHLTAPGLVVGTAPYMSPEQAGGEVEIDGRSDVYSLGCVLYELLAGVPPFVGVTARQVLAQHLTAPIPPLRAARPSVPPALEQAVVTALAKVPAERFGTARAFSEALANSISGSHVPFAPPAPSPAAPWAAPRAARRVTLAAVALTLIAGTVWAANWSWGTDAGGSERGAGAGAAAAAAGPDTTLYVVLPPDSATGAATSAAIPQRLGDALGRWSGVTIADGLRVRDTLAARARRPFASRDAGSIAAAFNAGRYVRSQATPSGDSLALRLALYDTKSNARLAEAAAVVAARSGARDSAMAKLADDLLFRGPLSASGESPVGTKSLPARQAYLAARAAVAQWDLATADSLLLMATRLDPQYARASLWLAQLRHWTDEPYARWLFAAERAEAGRARLDSGETILARALLAVAHGEPHAACPLFSRLVELDAADFASWYGLGSCLRRDDAVVRDARSPSGWRFRTSYRQALAAYDRAFQLFPAMHRSVRGGSFEDVQELLMTSTTSLRRGRALPPDTMQFLAYPAWQGDTLAFTPFPEGDFAAGTVATRSEAVNAAIREQRAHFHRTATMWRAAFPQSADALEAVAVSLDLLGNAAAFDSLRLARQLAGDEDDRLRMATLEVWMRVKFSAPSGSSGLREAWRLADSVLGARRPSDRAEAKELASLAALLGRASLAASYTRMAESRTAPAAIAQTAPALLAFAAMGGPRDSLQALEALVERGIRTTLRGADQDAARAGWLMRAALLAVPEHRFAAIPASAPAGSLRTTLLVAWRDDNLAGARATLATTRGLRQRASVRAFDLTSDALYPEAAVLASLGDARGAIAWLDPTLDSLSLAEPQALVDVARAGALVRAMALRAELADRVGDRKAAKAWGGAVLVLWSGSDEFLEPVVRRMRELTH